MTTFSDQPVVSLKTLPVSDGFMDRLLTFYRAQPPPALSPIWVGVSAYHAPLADALQTESGSRDRLRDVLEHVCSSNVIVGWFPLVTDDPTFAKWWDEALVRLGVSAGVIPLFNPEQSVDSSHSRCGLLAAVETVTGTTLTHPGGGGCQGMVVEERFVPIALLNAASVWCGVHRAFRLTPSRVLEIGAGSGFVAYLWWKVSGVGSYHIVDLPLVSVIQAFLLAGAIGEGAVCLAGEVKGGRPITIHGLTPPPAIWVECVINQDSLPELTPEEQSKNLALIERSLTDGGLFVSINQESSRGGQVRVFEAIQKHPSLRLVHRSPFFGRDGYLEEIWRKESSP